MNMDIFLANAFTGIVSGIITAFLIYVWYVFKKRIFDPWLENRLYKGVILEGRWVGKRVNHFESRADKALIHEEHNLQFELQQTGYNLHGIFSAEFLTAKGKEDRDKYSNMYSIKGHIHDNYAVLEYHPLSRKRTGFGTFLMEVKNGGKKMMGNVTFIEEGNMEITSMNHIVLNRVGEE